MVTWCTRRNPAINVNIPDVMSFCVVAALLALLWSVAIAAHPTQRAPLTCWNDAGEVTTGDDWKECR